MNWAHGRMGSSVGFRSRPVALISVRGGEVAWPWGAPPGTVHVGGGAPQCRCTAHTPIPGTTSTDNRSWEIQQTACQVSTSCNRQPQANAPRSRMRSKQPPSTCPPRSLCVPIRPHTLLILAALAAAYKAVLETCGLALCQWCILVDIGQQDLVTRADVLQCQNHRCSVGLWEGGMRE